MFVPPGFTVCFPYIFAKNAKAYLEFLTAALGGTVTDLIEEDGVVRNAHVRFGDTTIVVSEEQGAFAGFCGAYYLYVENADAAMTRAVAAGARAIMPVAEMPYRERQGGVEDPPGNIWWLSQRLKPGSY
jgi:PhnB protein